ncbi:MAG: PD40 domain-containing protein [Holophagales bacterium]|nr:MAG: PD40 domain-containing protein [Holophagales bacterium]
MPRIRSILLALLAFWPPTAAVAGEITRVSVDSAGVEANLGSLGRPSISSDGRFVAFASDASNLVEADTNGTTDVFVRDRETGTTSRVSVSSNGVEGNALSYSPSVSVDGRFVAFSSDASNLVGSDTNGSRDVFVHDRQAGTTTRASLAGNGAQANGVSLGSVISGDGRFVAFFSVATNLVANDTNGTFDVFVHDLLTGATTRVSVSSAGGQASAGSFSPSISGDGRFVAFDSLASNLVSGDTNASWDCFVHDRQTGTTSRVSVDNSGAQGNGTSNETSISADGRYVAFISGASNLVAADANGVADVFVHDRQTGMTTRVSVVESGAEANGASGGPSISDDGRFIAFASDASNLVPADWNGVTDVFRRDLPLGTVVLVSAAFPEAQANGQSSYLSISGDGHSVAFDSTASNLVPDDTNGVDDIFIERLEIFSDGFELGGLEAWSGADGQGW